MTKRKQVEIYEDKHGKRKGRKLYDYDVLIRALRSARKRELKYGKN